MKSFLMKHTGMPVPDLGVRYEIDAPSRVVRVDLDGHFDSALFVLFAQRVLEEDEGIKVIDDASKGTFGPAKIPGRFDIELHLAGQVFEVNILQLGDWMQRPGAAPAFTVSMLLKK